MDFLSRLNENRLVCIALFVLFLYLLPFFVLGEDFSALVHDNLDSTLSIYKVLAENGQIFAPVDTVVPNFMLGVPRNSLGTEFNFFSWLYAFFDPARAYIVNLCLMHLVAFAGMYLLLKNHFLKGSEYRFIAVGSALAFALLPFSPLGVLTVAGMPLALYAFLNIRAGRSGKRDWLILVLLPFYSSLPLGFVFFLFGMLLLWLYDVVGAKAPFSRGWREQPASMRSPNYWFLAAIVLMTLIFVVFEYRLFFNMFLDASYVSHRVEFEGYPNSFIMILGRSARSFIFGDSFALSLHHYFIFLAAALALAVLCLKNAGAGFLERFRGSLLVKLLAIAVAVSLLAEFMQGWDILEPLKDQIILLSVFTFSRFVYLGPLLWYVIFALSLKIVFDRVKRGKQIAVILIVLQAGFLFTYASPAVQSGGLGLFLGENPADETFTYAEFYSVELFQEIADYIGRPKSDYRVVSIGMQPSIAQYSGFYTLDFYHNDYPLEYKHKFREIIAKELEKSPRHLKRYFDDWGNRCYIFVAELPEPHYYTKSRNVKVNNLELNTVALREMGGEFVFSSVEILNADETGLGLLKVFERADSPWKIWLYVVE